MNHTTPKRVAISKVSVYLTVVLLALAVAAVGMERTAQAATTDAANGNAGGLIDGVSTINRQALESLPAQSFLSENELTLFSYNGSLTGSISPLARVKSAAFSCSNVLEGV